MTDAALARSIAEEAGVLLQSILADPDCPRADLGNRGDREANKLILDRLHRERPDDFVLS